MNSESQSNLNAPQATKTKIIILNTPIDDERPVYISGNFNNWATQDRRFLMKKISKGKYEFTFPASGELEKELIYKFTKGDCLVSIFSGLIYPEVFGKLMIFSPSLWVIPKIKLRFLDIFEPQETRLYLYTGGDESETMVKHVLKFRKRLLKRENKSSSQHQ